MGLKTLSLVSLIISIIPVFLKITLPGGVSTAWTGVNITSAVVGLTISIACVRSEESRSSVNADFVVILDSGKIAAEGTPLTLKNTYTGDFITLYGVAEEAVKALGCPYETIRDAYRMAVPDTATATKLIMQNPELFQNYEITKGKIQAPCI